jgi:hypothetical protein
MVNITHYHEPWSLINIDITTHLALPSIGTYLPQSFVVVLTPQALLLASPQVTATSSPSCHPPHIHITLDQIPFTSRSYLGIVAASSGFHHRSTTSHQQSTLTASNIELLPPLRLLPLRQRAWISWVKDRKSVEHILGVWNSVRGF